MTAETAHEPPRDEEQAILDAFLTLDTPEGFRAEFIEGEIVVSPPPGGPHEGVIALISRQVTRSADTEMIFCGNKGLLLRRGERCTKNHLVPDGVLLPLEDIDLLWEADSWMPSDGVAMVIEVTSGSPDRDRGVKRHCYAKAGIPLYLLVDRSAKSTSLFSAPEVGVDDYREVIRVAFGKDLDLPKPFGFTLDTTQFR